MRRIFLAVAAGMVVLAGNAAEFNNYIVPGLPAAVHYFANSPVERGNDAEIAVVIVHGWGNGVKLPGEGPVFREAAVKRLGEAKAPYVVQPMFPTAKTMAKFKQPDDGRARWCDSMIGRKDYLCSPADDWRGGGDADNAKLSSFEVIDRIFAEFADKAKYPKLKRVVLTGFSAGGQFSGRYVAVGKGVVREGVVVEYAPMAPSTWLRLDEEVDWLYGLKNRPRYSAGLSREQILANLSSRRQWNGCGSLDVKKKPQTALDSTPNAMKQGENRHLRFLSFRDYVGTFPKWAAQASFHVFEAVGHEGLKAYTDNAYLDFVLGVPRKLPVVDPAEYGFSPNAAPEVNAAALQKALDGGHRMVKTAKGGVYGLDRIVFIDDDTTLEFAPGTVLKKMKPYAQVLVNRAAYAQGATNFNITVKNVEISVNKMQKLPPMDSPAQGLRGHLAFYNVKNARVSGFRCTDCEGSQYCTQFVGFDGLVIEDFEIRGKKDGIHLNAGRNFIIRRGVLETGDDGVAINAGEWPGACTPLMGSITDGLVEDVTDDPGGTCNFARVITGAWLDWHPGMKLQNRDIVRVGRNVYGVHPMPVSTNEFVSMTAPSHTCGVWKSPEGINFLYLQSNGATQANIERVTFRNVRMNCKRLISCSWELGAWARLIHPELPRAAYPRIDILLENVVKTAPGPIVGGNADAKIEFRNCRAEKGPLLSMGWSKACTACPKRTVVVDGGEPKVSTDGRLSIK